MRYISLAPALLVLLVLAPACDEDSGIVRQENWGAYMAPTSPENQVENLATAYQRQEIGKYVDILAPEFVFKFQPQTAQDIGFDTWNRDQDSTGTRALFETQLVLAIRIDLPHAGAQEPTEPGFEPGTLKVRIQPTLLEVDQQDGTTWRVDGDIQDMFFRKGREAAGEDTTRWLLFEWRDIPGSNNATVSTSANPEAIQTVNWGRIKLLYEPFSPDSGR